MRIGWSPHDEPNNTPTNKVLAIVNRGLALVVVRRRAAVGLSPAARQDSHTGTWQQSHTSVGPAGRRAPTSLTRETHAGCNCNLLRYPALMTSNGMSNDAKGRTD
jgi:hypothetical protein